MIWNLRTFVIPAIIANDLAEASPPALGISALLASVLFQNEISNVSPELLNGGF